MENINVSAFFSKLKSERELEFKSLDLKVEDFVIHPNLGTGRIVKIKNARKINDVYIDIDFEIHGITRVLFIFAQLKRI